MRTQAFAIITSALLITLANGSAAAQSVAPKLSLAKPDWVSSEAFSILSAIRVLSNGTVLAVDGKETEVHLIDANGKIVRQIGRKGSGPGEYTRPAFLWPLPADSTLLLDMGARRYLIINPRGQIVKTEVISTALGGGADGIAGADPQGRLYFGAKFATIDNGVNPSTPIGRWTRGTDRFDTVTMFHAETPAVRTANPKGTGFTELHGQAREIFAPVDDWLVAPSGRIAIIHAIPYRVDWVELNGKTTTGTAVNVTRVPVTELDRKLREPNGPPYGRTYATLKSPFIADLCVIDSQDNVWVPRSEAAKFKNRRWDVFSATGQWRGTVLIPNGRTLFALTATHAYVRYIDSDGLQWVERYTR
ncbi:MAG: 6-bladed beta-propeller [Gemmatimonas sp.]